VAGGVTRLGAAVLVAVVACVAAGCSGAPPRPLGIAGSDPATADVPAISAALAGRHRVDAGDAATLAAVALAQPGPFAAALQTGRPISGPAALHWLDLAARTAADRAQVWVADEEQVAGVLSEIAAITAWPPGVLGEETAAHAAQVAVPEAAAFGPARDRARLVDALLAGASRGAIYGGATSRAVAVAGTVPPSGATDPLDGAEAAVFRAVTGAADRLAIPTGAGTAPSGAAAAALDYLVAVRGVDATNPPADRLLAEDGQPADLDGFTGSDRARVAAELDALFRTGPAVVRVPLDQVLGGLVAPALAVQG
jgi:hypothetical protein